MRRRAAARCVPGRRGRMPRGRMRQAPAQGRVPTRASGRRENAAAPGGLRPAARALPPAPGACGVRVDRWAVARLRRGSRWIRRWTRTVRHCQWRVGWRRLVSMLSTLGGTRMKTVKVGALVIAVLAAAGWAGGAAAQQVTGTLGTPSATTTLRGNQLPAPAPAFGGVIKEDALQSKPWWPPRVVPPKGAPNVLYIMTDDAGFGVPSTFGGVIPTPNMDRIAKGGLRYNRIFSTSLCSPTRAAGLTGRNHHSVG
ncbi:MAG: sulfatase-like hydrolase/transferase, partial [Burkholderiaceae bacterium]|nr:sulfatase-like hydrolase/transferase [Burkholderiaceae bacterium]